MWPVEVYVVAFITVLLGQWLYSWRNPKCNGLLPPGSSGLPLIGETLQLITPSYSLDVHPFFKKRLQKYGPLFRTNVAGRNVVISADDEFNSFILQQEGRLVVRWYLDLFTELFKECDGLEIHKYTRNLVLSHFGVECIKRNLLSQFEELVQRTLESWSMQDSIEVKSACAAMFGQFGAKLMYSCDSEIPKELTDNLINSAKGLMAFPLNIPGTTFHKCLKDKEKALNIIRDIVKARITSPQNNIEDDMLSKMIKDMSSVNFVTEEFITQQLFDLSNTSIEPIPSILEFCLKFISENPNVLRELIVEHEEILKKRETRDSSVTWEEYKSMTFTLQVINETLRLANIIPGFMRKAVKDIKVKGYTIQTGWAIIGCKSLMNLDPNTYKDPLVFDPWRWKGVTTEFVNKNLKPFGGGIKQCAGADFSRASMCIFLHVLVIKYRWTIVKGGDIVQNPILYFKNGVHITISERTN